PAGGELCEAAPAGSGGTRLCGRARGRRARRRRAGSGPFPSTDNRDLSTGGNFGRVGVFSVGDGGGEAAQRAPRGALRRCSRGARRGCAAGPALTAVPAPAAVPGPAVPVPAAVPGPAGAASGGQRRKVAGGFPRCKIKSGAEAQAGGQCCFQSKRFPIPARLCSPDPTVNAGHINACVHQQMHASIGIIPRPLYLRSATKLLKYFFSAPLSVVTSL
ncbi:unnamed protein product, partial [Bubo scandiacus]